MASTKQKMQQARQLIQEKRYDEARAILRTVDHDKAYEWLDKLDKIAPVKSASKEKPKNKTSWKMRLIQIGAGAFLFLCLCSIIASLGSDDSSETVIPTTAALASVTDSPASDTPEPTDALTNEPIDTSGTEAFAATMAVADSFASQTAIAPSQWTKTSTPTITLTPTNDPVMITLAAIQTSIVLTDNAPTRTPVPTNTPRPTNTQSPDQRNQADADLIETGFDFVGTDLDIASVEVVDGRANGGERGALISYRSTASTESDLLAEWGTIFGVVGGVVREFGVDLDALTIIVGDSAGMTTGIVSVQMDDVTAFLNQQLTPEQFFSRLTIESF